MTDQSIDDTRRDRLDRMVFTAVRGENAFKSAARHGRVVRVLRWAVPVTVVVGVAGFLALIYLPKTIGPVSFGQINIESNALVMATPRISGFDGDRRAYEIKAERALQSLSNPGEVTLEKIEGTVGFSGNSTASIQAGVGVYDREGERLDLSGGIDIATSNGYLARLEDAQINLSSGTLSSGSPVALTTPDGSIRGNTIDVSENGRRIVMTGDVRVVLLPSRTSTASVEPPAATSATPASP